MILGTEYYSNNNWESLKADADGPIKSHRPVTPITGGSSSNPLEQPDPRSGSAPFFYPDPESKLYTNDEIKKQQFLIEDPRTLANVVGRTHPGGGDVGGTSNFVYMDGHVDRTTVKASIEKRLWGDRFYSVTGNNQVNTKDFLK